MVGDEGCVERHIQGARSFLPLPRAMSSGFPAHTRVPPAQAFACMFQTHVLLHAA